MTTQFGFYGLEEDSRLGLFTRREPACPAPILILHFILLHFYTSMGWERITVFNILYRDSLILCVDSLPSFTRRESACPAPIHVLHFLFLHFCTFLRSLLYFYTSRGWKRITVCDILHWDSLCYDSLPFSCLMPHTLHVTVQIFTTALMH